MKKLKVYNPYNWELLDTVPMYDETSLSKIMETAEKGREISANLSNYEKINILSRASESIREQVESLAIIISSESGKPINQAKKEVLRCSNTIKLSAEAISYHMGELLPFSSQVNSINRFGYYENSPMGIIFAITPFNDPLNLVAHKLGPALAGGNAVILKPSNHTPMSAFALAKILYQSGLPESIIQIIPCSRELTHNILSQNSIRVFSFTGGEKSALILSGYAGLKKKLMELGGNAPVIVLPDVDINETAAACVAGGVSANGQNCISTQRVIVHSSIADKFIEQCLNLMKEYKVGDPLDESTEVGPLITHDAKDRFLEIFNQVQKGKNAKVLLSPKVEENRVSPCAIMSNPVSAFDHQEAFAPFIQFSSFTNMDEAINRANVPMSMIAAGIFTKNIDDIWEVTKKLQAASIMVNDSSDYRLDAMPFGGFKFGSLGREGVRFALQEMTQPKTVCFKIK